MVDTSAVAKMMEQAAKNIADLDGFRVEFICYNHTPGGSGWFIEWGECYFDDGSGGETSRRSYPDAGPGDFYHDFSPSANKCMIVVGGNIGMLHKPSNTRDTIPCGPVQAPDGECFVIVPFEIIPAKSIAKKDLKIVADRVLPIARPLP